MEYYISQGTVEQPAREVGNSVAFFANLLQYLCAKNI